jgi:hypothetical protein
MQGSEERSHTIPATESALQLHPCRAVPSAQSTFECTGSDGGASRIGIGLDGLLFPRGAGLTKWVSAYRTCGGRGRFNVGQRPVRTDMKVAAALMADPDLLAGSEPAPQLGSASRAGGCH